MQKRTINYYDSLSSTHHSCQRAIAEYLKFVLKDSAEGALECATVC